MWVGGMEVSDGRLDGCFGQIFAVIVVVVVVVVIVVFLPRHERQTHSNQHLRNSHKGQGTNVEWIMVTWYYLGLFGLFTIKLMRMSEGLLRFIKVY